MPERPMGSHRGPPSQSKEAYADLLARLLPPAQQLLEALAPEGWERSPLHRVFHPTTEQLRDESRRIRQRIRSLFGEAASHVSEEPMESKTEGAEDRAEGPVEPEREVVELLGCALWDVFSHNHSVTDDAGLPYCGSRADLHPVYRWIFERLRQAGCEWRYSFPRLYLVELPPGNETGDFLEYDPSEAVRAEVERRERRERRRSLADELERGYREAVRRARHEPLPSVVAAYREVYGRLPDGWPHPDM